MPISLPIGLPAATALAAEGVAVVGDAALHGAGARPLRICLVNLMPKKTATETQIGRLLGATPVPVEVTLCVPDSYQSRSAQSHIDAFYKRWGQIRGEHFDGMVMTGAPIETLPFEAVDYWMDLCAMLEWARARVPASFYICWAAQAALYHFRDVPKHERAAKLSGVYRQRVMRADSKLFRGFGDEFLRDRLAGKQPAIPANYFPDDDPTRPAVNVWRPWAHLLFGNWLAEIARSARARDEGGDQGRPLISQHAGLA